MMSKDLTIIISEDNEVFTSSVAALDVFHGLEITDDEEKESNGQVVEPMDSRLNSRLSEYENEHEDSDGDVDIEEKVELCESIFIYPNKAIARHQGHGDVSEGEMISTVCGITPCAIKMSDDSAREAELLQKLGAHKHVVTLFHSAVYQDLGLDRHYIVLERCHDMNLNQYLFHRKENEETYEIDWGINICKQIINGMKYIHERLIIHKDLKPSNILLTHDLSTIKIADFGSSQELKYTSSMTFCLNMFGTIGYRPPESFGRSYISLKSDIFALGALLYFILSNGGSPFGNDPYLWEHNTVNDVVDLTQMLVPNRRKMEHLIKAMLHMDRRSRPSIWKVGQNPCWTADDNDGDIEYYFQEETNDDGIIEDDSTEVTDESDDEVEVQRQTVRILERFLPKTKEIFLILFERLSKHLLRFNPRTNHVTQMHEMNEDMKKNLYAPVLLGEYIYVIMSNRSFYRLKCKDTHATWESLRSIVDDHGWFPPAVGAAGRIYVVGRVSGTFTKTVSRYSPSSNKWERITDKNLAARDAAITSTDHYVYCIGGWIDGIGASNRVERLDLRTQEWDEINPMIEGRYYATAVQCKGNIFVLGGRNRKSQKVNTVEKYCLTTNQWASVKPMTKLRYGSWFRCHFIDDSIFAISGDYEETIEKYDLKNDEWTGIEINGPKLDIYCSIPLRLTS